MIGKLQFEISHEDFAKGMNTVDDLNDGGFSSLSKGISLKVNPGWITSCGAVTEALTAASNPLTKTAIASCENPSLDGIDRIILDTNSSFSTLSGSTLVIKKTDSTNAYSAATSDIVSFNGEFFATTNNGGATQNDDITKLTSDYTTLDETWWSTTMSKTKLYTGVRHPMIVFASELYIGDGNLLHKISWNGSTYVIVYGILSLSTGRVINALGIDPGTGKLMVAISNAKNVSNTRATTSYIGLYGGYSPTQFVREVPTDEQVNAIYNLGGNVFVIYGINLGIWNGAGIKFLRKLNVDYDSNQLVYKHHITSIDDVLFIAEGPKILAYGTVVGQKDKVFWYQSENLDFDSFSNPVKFSCIFNKGSGNLAYCFPKASDSKGQVKFYNIYANGSSTTTNSVWYSLSYHMPRYVFVRGIDVFLHARPTGNENHDFYLKKDDLSSTHLGFVTSSDVKGFKRLMCNEKTATIQILDGIFSSVPLERIIIYYDLAE